MPTPKDLLARLWRRHQHPANWCLHLGATCCLCLGMWTGSSTAASAAIVLLGAGFLDFHLPAKGPVWLRRIIQAEVVWVNSPWTRTKRLQAALMGLFMLIGSACLLADFLPGMLLLVGVAALLKVRSDNRAAGVDP